MPFTSNPYTWLGSLLGLAVLLVISAFVGWHLRGWHDDANQLKEARSDVYQIKRQVNGIIDANNALASTIVLKNQATDSAVAGMTVALGNQSHELTQLQVKIKSIPVGTCQFTPDADGMLQHAYESSFGHNPYPIATPGKARGGDAVHQSSSASDGYQPIAPKPAS
jgi:hypothetical protein